MDVLNQCLLVVDAFAAFIPPSPAGFLHVPTQRGWLTLAVNVDEIRRGTYMLSSTSKIRLSGNP